MNKFFTLLFLIIIFSAFGQSGSVNCICSESQIKVDTKPDTIFYLENRTPISFCGYKFKNSKPPVYLKFVLAFCLSDTILTIDTWNANQSCHIRTIGDTLFVDEIDTKRTEKIYLNGLDIVRKTVETKVVAIERNETPIKTVDKIFKWYIKQSESTDSQRNKDAMEYALKLLVSKSETKDFSLLVNVWMYYDPTDFPTRPLIEPIFIKNRKETLTAIDKQLRIKKKWKDKEIAPYSDLIALKKQIEQPQN